VWIAKNDVGGPFATHRIEVVDPQVRTVRWLHREHYDYGRDAPMVPIVTPISQIYRRLPHVDRGHLAEWTGIIRKPYLRNDPEGFRPAKVTDLVVGATVYVWGTDRGEGKAYGPHTYTGYLSGHLLRNKHGRTFREDINFILIKEQPNE
jgi:hypothetical protein